MRHQGKAILITGASGFLGTWLANEARRSGYALLGIDVRTPLRPDMWSGFAVSSLETVDLGQLLGSYRLDAVFHLAGGASVASSIADPFGDFSSLLPGTARLAVYLGKHKVDARLFMFSSAAVYGNPATLPITEQTPVSPISPYGAHKAITETLLMHYARIFGLRVTFLRIFSVYGSGLRKQLIWDVGQRALAAVRSGIRDVLLRGTGHETRDFIHVKDVCRAALYVLAKTGSLPVEVINIASGHASPVSEVARLLLDSLDLDLDLSFDGAVPPGDPAQWRVDIARLHRLGFAPRYSLSAGLRETAAWMKTIYEQPGEIPAGLCARAGTNGIE